MSRILVTASGTETGKTFVMRALIGQLRAAGKRVHALKPIATGADPGNGGSGDTELLAHALGLNGDAATVTRWRFRAPLSPDMAAAREQAVVPFQELLAFCEPAPEADVTLIEGIGGVMVPLDGKHTVLDWIAALGSPALLVVGSYLGTLSHTLTAAGMLRAHAVKLAGIIVNQSPDQPVPAEETAAVLARFSAGVPVAVLPRVGSPGEAPDLLHLISSYL